MNVERTLDVVGMTCRRCENTLREKLKGLEGVLEVRPKHRARRVDVTFDPTVVSEDRIRDRIRAVGYEVRLSGPEGSLSLEAVDLPDRVPEGLLARFGPEARKVVRSRRARRHRLARALRGWTSAARDGEVWATAAAVFLWLLLALGALGGIAYGLFLWPWAGLYVVLPLVTLVSLSFLTAVHLTRRERSREDPSSVERWPPG